MAQATEAATRRQAKNTIPNSIETIDRNEILFAVYLSKVPK